jgi:FkbM family methyltransferase
MKMQNSSFLTRITKGIKGRLRSIFNNPYGKVNIGWWDVKYYKHLPPGKLRSHKLFGHAFYFYSPQEFLHGLKELFVEELYRQNLGPRPFVIDCGANVGLSIIYTKQLFPDAEIIAFEPDETNFELLSKNIASFGYTGVSLRKEAIWKENTVLRFSNEGSMSSQITGHQTEQSREVQAVRLYDLLTRTVDFLKMDIEGAEFDVVMDIADRLHHVRNMFVEYHGLFGQEKELNRLLAVLTEKGYLYYIKEAASVYDHPFCRVKNPIIPYDIQLNIFCFRSAGN